MINVLRICNVPRPSCAYTAIRDPGRGRGTLFNWLLRYKLTNTVPDQITGRVRPPTRTRQLGAVLSEFLER